ncbi:MAG TPA: LysE family translocator [Ktedonobacteraceae bacterium]|nr:LysE family translocator [Ktedonobacteraceae bacterium]
MFVYLIQGLILGVTAGISPGPMLGLVITQTLRRGWRAGSLVACAPLFSDLPIIFLLVVVLRNLPSLALQILAFVGGLFVIYLGIETIRSASKTVSIEANLKNASTSVQDNTYRILFSAVLTNFLNPHPYLFWATIGSTLLLQSYALGGLWSSGSFLVGFYLCLVGAKLALVLLVSRSRTWLQGQAYKWTLQASGLLLLGLGYVLIWESFQKLHCSRNKARLVLREEKSQRNILS